MLKRFERAGRGNSLNYEDTHPLGREELETAFGNLVEEIRTFRRAQSCFFSIDALENYMRRVFEEVERAIASEAKEARDKYIGLLSLPLTGGLMGMIDAISGFGLLPEGLKIAVFTAAAIGAIAFAFLWYRARLLMLERLKKFAFERSFIAGELLSYIRSFAGTKFSMEVPVGYEQIILMITVSWVALGLYFAESYEIEFLISRLRAMLASLRPALVKLMDELEKTEIYMGLPSEAKQPFLLLKERLAEV